MLANLAHIHVTQSGQEILSDYASQLTGGAILVLLTLEPFLGNHSEGLTCTPTSNYARITPCLHLLASLTPSLSRFG